ncbi:MAG: CPBP family intramembrane metalloprotease [Clostridia bacterium]|nr:CPBP family intramembrane metalloprotease [Clostridia bacterium]
MKNKRYLVTLIIYGTAILLLMGLQVLVSLGCFNQLSDEALEVVGSVLPQIVIMLGVPCLMLLVAQKINHEPVAMKRLIQFVNWRKLSFKHVLLCFIVGICIYILNIFIASVFGALLQSLGYQYNQNDNVFTGYTGLLISLVLTAILPGICEEFLHRGILLNGLIKQVGVRRAILWSSFLFGLMHMNVGQFFYASILGWFMGVTALATGSLWGSIIIHFTNNALATYMSYADELHLPGANLVSFLFGNGIALILTILIVVIIIGELLRVMAREKFNHNLDSYTVRYLSAQNHFNVDDFERLKTALPRALQTLPTWKATAAYIETFDQPQRAKPLERALLVIIVLIGSALTVLSFVWGTW